MEKGYNIALHCIRNYSGSREKAEAIMKDGLNMPKSAKSIRSTTIQLGDKYRNEKLDNELPKYLSGYRFGAESEGYIIIVKSPTVIKNSREEVLYLGDPYTDNNDKNKSVSGQEYDVTSFLDTVCEKYGKIPSEFIYGYVIPADEKNSIDIVKNPNYYANFINKDADKQDRLFEDIRNKMDNIEQEISEMIAKEDRDGLKKIDPLLKAYSMTQLLNIIKKAEEQYLR